MIQYTFSFTVSCYQCAWSPGRTVYKTVTYYDEERVLDPYSYGHDHGKYVTKRIKKTKQVNGNCRKDYCKTGNFRVQGIFANFANFRGFAKMSCREYVVFYITFQ